MVVVNVELFKTRYSKGIRISNSKKYSNGTVMLLNTLDSGELSPSGDADFRNVLINLSKEGTVKVWEIEDRVDQTSTYTFQDTLNYISASSEREQLETMINDCEYAADRLNQQLSHGGGNRRLEDRLTTAAEMLEHLEMMKIYSEQLSKLPYVNYRVDLSIFSK